MQEHPRQDADHSAPTQCLVSGAQSTFAPYHDPGFPTTSLYTKRSLIWQRRDQKLIWMNLQHRVGDFGDSSLPLANRTAPASMLTVLQQMAMGHTQMKQMPTNYLDQPCHPCKKIACQVLSYTNGLQESFQWDRMIWHAMPRKLSRVCRQTIL